MIAIVCQHANRRTNGVTKAGAVRWRCKDCGASWTESTELLAGMTIGVDRAAKIVELMCEGMSVRGIVRTTGTALNTVLGLLKYVGERCDAYMAEHIRGVHCDAVQVDEIWQYVFCKKATAKQMKYVGGCGDSWTFTAVERHTKLLVAWHMPSLANSARKCSWDYSTRPLRELSGDLIGYTRDMEATRWQSKPYC